MLEENTIKYWKEKALNKGRLALFSTIAASLLGCAYAEFLSSKKEIETIKKIQASSRPVETLSSEILMNGKDTFYLNRTDTIGWFIPKNAFTP